MGKRAPPPLPVEIVHSPGEAGNGRTYTSRCPDLFDVNATHFPSGENVGSNSANSVLRNGVGVPGLQPSVSLPSIGRIMMSLSVLEFLGLISSNARNFPVGCHETGV